VVRVWQPPAEDTADAAARLTREQHIPRPAAFAMVRRGLEDGTQRDSFLNPRLKHLGDPRIIRDMERAATRAWDAVDRGEEVFVHGDYDVDGITGAAFLTRTLTTLGGRVTGFVPNRDEGYGLGDAGIEAARAVGATLLITVDCGMTAYAEVRTLQDSGIDVIVLDHHEPGSEIPEATAVVNPLRGGADRFTSLSAVGLAAKLLHAMALVRPGTLDSEDYKEALQLVALGTIADVVPLLGENRVFVSYGLRRLERSRWVGVQALKATARLSGPRITSTDVAFSIAPRINALGRMGEARDALALLLTDDPVTAYRLADRMERLNRDRRTADEAVLQDALEQLRLREELPSALVLWSDQWPVGVVGIAANRILDRFHRPALLIAVEGEKGRGSARAPDGFPLPEALAACDDLLDVHGGHARAAGFTIPRANLEAFRDRIESIAAGADLTVSAAPWALDATVSVEELDAACVGWLERLEPFGQGNPEPLFGSHKVRLEEAPAVVGGRHLRLGFRTEHGSLKGIAFGLGSRVNEFSRGQEVDVVYHASFDLFRGGRTVQLVVRDIR